MSKTPNAALKTGLTRAELDAFLAERGFKVDGYRDPWAGGSNKFHILYIGIGRSYEDLRKLATELTQAFTGGKRHVAGVGSLTMDMKITHTTNHEHPDFGKPMIEIDGFWNE